MDTKRFYSFLTIIAILGMFAATPQPAQASVATIYAPDNYPTIGEAVNTANFVRAQSQSGYAVDDYVWIVNTNADTVSKVNKLTNEIVATVNVGNNPQGIAVDDKYVWVANSNDSTVSKIDKTNNLVAATIVVGTLPVGVAVDDKYVWVTNIIEYNVSPSTLSRIDKTDNTVETYSPGLEIDSYAIAVDEDNVWVAAKGYWGGADDNRLYKLNKSGEIIAQVLVRYPLSIAIDEQYVWVTNSGSTTVSQINRITEASTTIAGFTHPYLGISLDKDYVWVANSDLDTVSKIDKLTNTFVTFSGFSFPMMYGDATGYSYDRFFAPDEPLIPVCGEGHTQGMISYWQAENNATDSFGTNDGIINGAIFSTGRVGQAFSMDGVDDYINAGNDSSLNPTDAITIEVWVLPNASVPDYGRYVSKLKNPWLGEWDSAVYLLGQQGSDETNVRWEQYYNVIQSGTGKVTTGVWNHVVATYDKNAAGNNRKIFVNGVLVASDRQTYDMYSGTGELYLGTLAPGDQHYKGLLDEVAIYNRALTEGEISQHYLNGLSGEQYCTSATEDIVAPITEAVLIGTPGGNGWYRSDILVTLTAQDNEGGVGVLKTEYSLDGGTWQGYTQPFTVTKEGITTLLYRSIDKANNQEQDKTLEIKIDKTEPTLSLTDIIGFGSANESQGTSDNPVMFRMDTEGNILWKKDLPFEDFNMTDILADRNLAEDTVYLFISAGGTNLMDGKGQLQKYNMYGDLVWSLPLTTGSTGATVSADPVGGGAYVASDEGIWRVGVAGNVLWGPKTLGFGTGAGEWAVATDVLTGGSYAARNNGNILLKLDNQGNLLWQQSISNPYRLNFSPTDGGVYVGSGTWGNDHVHKFDSQGNQQWVKNNFPSPWTYWRTVSSVDGSLYIWSGWNEYLAKIMPDGTVAWSTWRSGGWGNASVAADIEQNKVYTTEIFERLGVTTFNGSTGALLWQKDPGYYAPHWASDDYGPLYWVYTGMPAQTLPDTTPPTITPTINGIEGNNGWYTSDVTVNWDVRDPETEIASSIGCDTTTLTADTTGDTLTCSATNGVGLSNSVSVTIPIDKTAPTIAALISPALPASGWWNIASGVPTVSFACNDTTSGLAGTCPEAYTFPEGENQSYAQTVYDNAGNSAIAGISNIDVDLIAPTIAASIIPALPASGWWNIASGAPTVSFVCSDATSGLAGTCPAAYTFPEGENQSYSQTVYDKAGNSASDGVNDVDVDLIAPTLTWNSLINDGDSFYFGSVPTAPTCTASDSLSGLDGSCNVSGYATTVGLHTLTATAKDWAGNQATGTRSYSVLPWTLNGFYQPVDMNGVYNIVKNGSTVPLKFEIFAGSTELTDIAYIKSLTYAQTSCDASATTDEIETTATGGTSLRYDSSAGQFIYNWKTPRTAGKCYRVTMMAIDGSSLVAYFKLK